MKKLILVLCLTMTSLFSDQWVDLTPPILSEESIEDKVACTRPLRNGKFNISTEEIDDKIVVNCYGHGGSGCTVCLASVERAIEIYEKKYPNQKERPIRIIGQGIIGLNMALKLSEKGYRVVGITAKDAYDIPSWKNAGYFALVSLRTAPEEEGNLCDLFLETFNEYQSAYEGKHPYLSPDCVKYMPVYCSAETNSGLGPLQKAGLLPPPKKVTLSFGNGVVHPNFVEHETFYMDVPSMMTQMTQKVKERGIPIEEGTVYSFNEIAEPVVFNCCGVGARELNHDDEVVPVRGHLLNLSSAAGSDHLNYMIYTEFPDSNGVMGYVYLFPKRIAISSPNNEMKSIYGTLGGTFIPQEVEYSKEELTALDLVEYQSVYDRSMLFFYGK